MCKEDDLRVDFLTKMRSLYIDFKPCSGRFLRALSMQNKINFERIKQFSGEIKESLHTLRGYIPAFPSIFIGG